MVFSDVVVQTSNPESNEYDSVYYKQLKELSQNANFSSPNSTQSLPANVSTPTPSTGTSLEEYKSILEEKTGNPLFFKHFIQTNLDLK